MTKTLLIASIALTPCLAPLTTSAELLVYKGVLTQQYFGANNQENRSWKIIVVVDHDTGHFARLSYGTLYGVKRYFTLQTTDSHIVDVTGLRGKSASAITRIPTDCETQQNPGGESVYFDGANATLTVNTATTTSFPRVMNHRGGALLHTSSSNLPYLEDYSYTLGFNQAATVASNQAGETLDTTLANLVASVTAQGYQQ